ncbi:hypothetical protein EU537_09325 [Candidatus Thorarchaeota archaeon]|nr:MAG: hypothetical protein EU537_09325 [Candidatus Thorarchaeota archaeon]
MTTLTYIPIDGERLIAESSEYLISNYRIVQYDRGSRTVVSIPLHIIKEYKLTSRAAMFKVINGIINVLGAMPRREELRGALGLREFENLNIGEQRKICEVCGVPFVHPNQPYNRWVSVGYHRKFSKHFYTEFAWLKGEAVFTYYPDNFVMTNYRLYQRDSRKNKLYMFPFYMIETFEARKGKLRVKATTGNFEVRGHVPRQDHMLKVWQNREWTSLPKEHLDWLVRPFRYIQARHPLSQYEVADTASQTYSPVAEETSDEIEMDSTSKASGSTVFVRPVIKNKCDNCGAPMSWEQIDWTGPDQYSCPHCRHTHTVQYSRM